MPSQSADLFVVLASRKAFEAFTGPVPQHLEHHFRFVKPSRNVRLTALLPRCRMMISKSYLQPAVNRWILTARRAGVPTLLLVDGPLEWSNIHDNPSIQRKLGDFHGSLMAPVIHDAVATLGPEQTRWIEHKNPNRGIRFMSQANHRIRTQPDDDGANETDVEFDFLVTTAKTAAFNQAERHALEAALLRCCKELDAAGFRYVLRIFDESLAKGLPAAAVDTTGSFREALARTRCVIGTPSSVMLEAMQHGKPTATLVFRDSPLFYQTGWLLGTAPDWQDTLRSMRAGDPDRMDFQRLTLEANLSQAEFFDHCDRFLAGAEPTVPRPLDAEDLAFENHLLHRLLGWRARWLSPIARFFTPRSNG